MSIVFNELLTSLRFYHGPEIMASESNATSEVGKKRVIHPIPCVELFTDTRSREKEKAKIHTLVH